MNAFTRSRSESTIKGVTFGAKPKVSVLSVPPPIEEPNALLGDVRQRLDKLREQLFVQDMQEKFEKDQQRLQVALFEEELQTVISRKIKEAVAAEESLSINSRLTGQSKGWKGPGQPMHHEHLHDHRVKTAEQTHNNAIILHAHPHPAHTYPSTAPARSHHNRSRSTSPAFREEEFNVNDELSDLGSVGSLSLGSLTGRPSLIVIRKSDIDRESIRQKVCEKLPSPEKPVGDPTYPTASFPACVIAQRQKERADAASSSQSSSLKRQETKQRLGVLTEGDSEKSDQGSGKAEMGRQGSGRWNVIKPFVLQRNGMQVIQREGSFGSKDKEEEELVIANTALRPAPFLKARSSSGILKSAPEDAPVLSPPPKDVVGPMVRGLSVMQTRKAARRASQQFAAGEGALRLSVHLEELQGTDILQTRFGGWASATASEKRSGRSPTNFY